MFAPGSISTHRLPPFLALLWSAVLLVPNGHGAGVTIITHGFNGDVQGWVSGMAANIPGYYRFPGTNIICYEVIVSDSGGFVVTPRKVAGGHPTNDSTAEIVIKLDWGALAGFFAQYDTYEVAGAVVPRLLQTNFIAELGGHALAELPIHLIGHSRGGSLVCQMSRLLGTNGVWVDHLTTLDPHPVNEDGNSDPLLVSDAPLRVYDNVLFADNFFQEFGGYPHGQIMPGSCNRRFTALPGGYSSAHSDVHLWYHGTMDLRDPADDTEAILRAADRAIWFTPYEVNGKRAGIHYSLLGGGDRLSLAEPAGSGTDRPVDGYNQRWSLGAGASANRTALPINSGGWPNLVRFNLVGTNLMAQGQTNVVTFHYQWARPATSHATVSIYLDADFNPWNGNERLVGQATVVGTASTNVGAASARIDLVKSNSTPGMRALFAIISGGGHTRCLYAPELLTVFSSFEPPAVGIALDATPRIQVDVAGLPGQRIVLAGTTDLRTWQPLATNWLTTDRWSYSETPPFARHRFYRAELR